MPDEDVLRRLVSRRVGITKCEEEDFYYKLWKLAWKDQNCDALYETRTTRRDEGEDRTKELDDQIPPYTVLKEVYGQTRLKGILIRSEYRKALHDIAAWRVRGNNRGTPVEDPDPTYVDLLRKDGASVSKGAIIVGHPGIGKTLFLQYVLIERLLMQRPTILFSHTGQSFHVFDAHGVFKVASNPEAPPLLFFSEATWILVDSNSTLKTVPEWLTLQDGFIVQSASPCQERLEWPELSGSEEVTWWFMWPPTLQELI